MNQIATVVRMLDPETAEIKVVRQSACAHDCAECAGCGAQPMSISVSARCTISVEPGDKVEIYSDNRVLGYAALVYLVPLVLFLVGYLLPPDASEMVRFLCGVAGFCAGIALAVVCDRAVHRNKSVTYRIVRKI